MNHQTTTSRHNHRTDGDDRLPSAVIKRGHLSWLLWLVPAGAACLCAWFIYRDYISTGPLITLYFKNADGVEEKNTDVKYRGAIVGQVKEIALTKDNQQVKLTARLAGSAKNLARAGSVFWIVRPELKVGSVSGLRTIISGEYVAVEPGNGSPTNTFVGAEKEPTAERPHSIQFVLVAPNLGSMEEGTPVFYRGIQVGEVLAYQLSADARQVSFRARVWPEYAPLVRPESKFWNAGGLEIHAGLFKGIQISAESPRTILSGGIEFATPTNSQAQAADGTIFSLYDKPDEKWRTWAPTIALNLQPEASQTQSGQTNGLKDLHFK